MWWEIVKALLFVFIAIPAIIFVIWFVITVVQGTVGWKNVFEVSGLIVLLIVLYFLQTGGSSSSPSVNSYVVPNNSVITPATEPSQTRVRVYDTQVGKFGTVSEQFVDGVRFIPEEQYKDKVAECKKKVEEEYSSSVKNLKIQNDWRCTKENILDCDLTEEQKEQVSNALISIEGNRILKLNKCEEL